MICQSSKTNYSSFIPRFTIFTPELNPLKIKILFVSNTSWSMWNYRRQVLQHYLAKGYTVYVLATPDNSVPRLESMGVNYIPVHINAASGNPLQIFSLTRALNIKYKEIRPDLIIHYTIKPNTFGSIAAHIAGIPSWMMITGRGYAFSKKGIMQAAAKYLYKRAATTAEKIFFLNRDDIDFFVENRIIPKDKIVYLPGEGVDCNHFTRSTQYPPKKHSFYFVGRLLKDKGVEIFAEAARKVLKQFPDIEFNVLGPTDFADKNSVDAAFVENLKKEGKIHYLGETDDIKSHLEKASCVVLPSYYEGVPFSILEAAAMEVPIITTDSVGCRDVVIDGETGFLVEKKNVKDLTEKLKHFIELPYEKRKEMGEAGRKYVCDRFPIDKVIAVYEKEIKESLNE